MLIFPPFSQIMIAVLETTFIVELLTVTFVFIPLIKVIKFSETTAAIEFETLTTDLYASINTENTEKSVFMTVN